MSHDIPLLSPQDPHDEEDVALNPDQKAVLIREFSEQAFGYSHLVNLFKNNQPVQRGLLRSVLYMADARTAQACAVTGIELESAVERENRYARMRALNERVRELERELGMSGTPEQTKQHLAVLTQNLKKWWRADGFGHAKEVFFTEYGHAKVELSCYLHGDFPLIGSMTPVTDKDRRAMWLQSVADRGFLLQEEDRDLQLVDCDQNRAAVVELLTKAMPSSKLVSTENHSTRCSGMALRSLHVYVYDLQDLHGLTPRNTLDSDDI